MTTENFCFYLQNRLIQTSQTGGQWYNDTSPFSIPWLVLLVAAQKIVAVKAGTSIHLACLPCQQPALSACLPACQHSLPALFEPTISDLV